MTLRDALLGLQGPLLNGAVGLLLALLAEFLPPEWYANAAPKVKRLIFLGTCLVLPVLSALAGCLMGYQAWDVDTFFGAFWAGGLIAFGDGTMLHTLFIGRQKAVRGQ